MIHPDATKDVEFSAVQQMYIQLPDQIGPDTLRSCDTLHCNFLFSCPLRSVTVRVLNPSIRVLHAIAQNTNASSDEGCLSGKHQPPESAARIRACAMLSTLCAAQKPSLDTSIELYADSKACCQSFKMPLPAGDAAAEAT